SGDHLVNEITLIVVLQPPALRVTEVGHFHRRRQRQVAVTATLARAYLANLNSLFDPLGAGELGEFLHLGFGVFAILALELVADVGPANARAFHDPPRGGECVAALPAAGAQHANELRDPFPG